MIQSINTKIQNFIYKYIFIISLYITLTTLAFFIYGSTIDVGDTINTILYHINISYFKLSFFKSDQFEYLSPIGESSYRVIELLTPCFFIVMLIGAILYILSKRAEKRILQFCFSIIFIVKTISILVIIIELFTVEELFSNILWLLLFVFKIFLILYIAYTFLSKSTDETLIVEQESEKIYFGNGDLFLLKHKRASRKQRFLHYIIDLFIIVIIFSRYIFIIPRDYIYTLEKYLGEQLAGFSLFFIASSIYYLVSEGIFKTTPAKYLTQTKIIFFVKEKVSIGQVVARTFSRRIPFEAFSFFGKIGWHDSISRTTVVKLKDNNLYKKWAIIILILLGILIAYRLILPFFRYF